MKKRSYNVEDDDSHTEKKKMTEEEDVDSTRNIFKKRGISSHATIT